MRDWRSSADLGYTVVGISRDGVKAHQVLCEKQGFRFELLSDKDETVCRLFDVIKLKKLYGKESFGIERSTFVLNKDGEIVMNGGRSRWRAMRRKCWKRFPDHAGFRFLTCFRRHLFGIIWKKI